MRIRNLVCATVVAAFLALVVAAPQPAFAWGGCSNSYVVQWGDTLFSIGMRYGVTVTDMRQANPNLGYWLYAGQTICIPDGHGYQDGGYNHGYDGYNQGYDGHQQGYDGYQQGYDGCGYGGCGYQQGYDGCGYGGCGYQQGGYDGHQQGYDGGCGGYGCGQYDGYAPGYGGPDGCGQGCSGYGYHSQGAGYGYDGGQFYTVQRGDTLAKIAARCGTTWYRLLMLNPGIWNPNWIYAGQVIRVR
jgi:LysM repeat protein